jgi:hypothetical protein
MTTFSSQVTTHGSRKSLAGLFASPALADLLRVLLLHGDAPFHQRELARLTGAGLRSVQAETRRLEGMGLVISDASGNRRTYSVDWSHPAADDLRRFFVRSFAVPELLRDALAAFGDDIVAALLYGSTARGEERASSDIDLLVVGDVDVVSQPTSPFEIEGLLGTVTRSLADARVEGLSADGGFSHAYGAVLGAATVVLRSEGLRIRGGHHLGCRGV